MKLLRIGEKGSERPAVLDDEERLRDLSAIVSDFSPETLGPALLSRIARADLSSLPELRSGQRIGAPLSRVGHFIAIGLNYADHAAEAGAPVPPEPIIFSKAPSSLSGPNDDIVLPRGSLKADWEVELAVIIGTAGSYIAEEDALAHVFAYTICNDVSEREYQMERGGQWIKGKSAPGFGPLGPWMVTADRIPDPQSLDMFLDLNGERMQTGNTATMIFTVRELIAYTSRFMRLEAGDVITTGTPPGVGLAKSPPRFLRGGDTIHLGIMGLGEQQQRIRAADD